MSIATWAKVAHRFLGWLTLSVLVAGALAVGTKGVLAYNDPIPVDSTTVGLWGQVSRGGLGSCIDDPGGSTSWGTQMQLWSCAGNANQQWRVLLGTSVAYMMDDVVIMQNMASGLCLDVKGRNAANFTPAIQWGCSFDDPAQWMDTPWNYAYYLGTPHGAFEIHAFGVGTCLDDPGQNAANGTRLEFYQCNQTIAQAWIPANINPSWVALVRPYCYVGWIEQAGP